MTDKSSSSVKLEMKASSSALTEESCKREERPVPGGPRAQDLRIARASKQSTRVGEGLIPQVYKTHDGGQGANIACPRSGSSKTARTSASISLAVGGMWWWVVVGGSRVTVCDFQTPWAYDFVKVVLWGG